MKKYQYRVVEQTISESDEDFLKRVNSAGQEGFRYLIEHSSNKGMGRIVMEKEQLADVFMS